MSEIDCLGRLTGINQEAAAQFSLETRFPLSSLSPNPVNPRHFLLYTLYKICLQSLSIAITDNTHGSDADVNFSRIYMGFAYQGCTCEPKHYQYW